MLFVAATGLCTGAFFEVCMSGSGKEQLMTVLNNFFTAGGNGLSMPAAFWQSFRGSLVVLLLFFLSPLLIILLPFTVLYLFFKGLFAGFSAAMLIETMGLRGVLYSLLTLMPSCLLQLLLFALLAMVSLQSGAEIVRTLLHRLHLSGHARGLRTLSAAEIFTPQYRSLYACGLAALLVICLLEVFLLQLAI